jgi:hypothetical protein
MRGSFDQPPLAKYSGATRPVSKEGICETMMRSTAPAQRLVIDREWKEVEPLEVPANRLERTEIRLIGIERNLSQDVRDALSSEHRLRSFQNLKIMTFRVDLEKVYVRDAFVCTVTIDRRHDNAQ